MAAGFLKNKMMIQVSFSGGRSSAMMAKIMITIIQKINYFLHLPTPGKNYLKHWILCKSVICDGGWKLFGLNIAAKINLR